MPAYLKPILYALVGALTATLVITTTALAGSGVGGVFNLGVTNTVNQKSTLTGATADPELLVQNTGAGTALSLVGGAGAPAFKVNSATKIGNLNADLLDGLDSAALQKRVTGTCAAGQAIRVVNANGSVSCQAVAGAGGSWSLSGNAGTTPGSNFLGTKDNKLLQLNVNGQGALRLVPRPDSPNLIGGFSGNGTGIFVAEGVTIGGGGMAGAPNLVTADFGTVSGGIGNTASGYSSTVAGGNVGRASGDRSTIAGGSDNTATGAFSTVGGGHINQATELGSTVAGGFGNTASGKSAMVPGGNGNTASGNESLAAGTWANATKDGSFVWGDATFTNLTSPTPNSFTVRASGGIWLGTNSGPAIPGGHFLQTSTGGYLSSAGAWTNNSDRASKHDIEALNRRSVLERVAHMPVTSWSYKAEKPSVRHIGPMAQDFYKAFGLGLDDKHITTIDADGVALAAIQGLYRQNQALQHQNRTLRARLGAQNARLTQLEQAFSKLSR